MIENDTSHIYVIMNLPKSKLIFHLFDFDGVSYKKRYKSEKRFDFIISIFHI